MPMRLAKLFVSLMLIMVTLAAYWQVKDHEFINYDDNDYITDNVNVKEGLTLKGVLWAFSATYANNWHPLTWLSHMLDCQLYGLNPRGHHLTNLLLHLVNALLLFFFFAHITQALWPSALVAALFALHPLHVESVAWVAERKDVLSTFFWIITMWAYLWYTERGGLKRYLLCQITFAFGLMTKPMLVTLPLVLILLDYWPLGRMQVSEKAARSSPKIRKFEYPSPSRVIVSLIWEKVPLLVLAGLSCLITLMAQKEAMELEVMPPTIRLANALVSYASYLVKTMWPWRLAFFYPHPGTSIPWWQVAGAGVALTVMSFLALREARRHPYLPVGWFWYLGTLVPVIGVVQVGAQAMADRYTYIPLIGIFLVVAWGAWDLTARWPRQRIILGLATGILLPSLMMITWLQVGHWRNSQTLFEHAIKITDNNYLAYSGLIDIYASEGRIDEAIAMFQKAIQIKPNYAEAYNDMGIVLGRQGKIDESITLFKKAIQIKPNYTEAYNNLGIACAIQGRVDEAIVMFQRAIKIDPHNRGAKKMLDSLTNP